MTTEWSILLVDDEEDILVSMKEYLEVTIPELEVKTATGGAKALEILEDGPVDLIITDYKMPEMDGLEFLRRAAKMHPAVPRIILTAFPKLDLAIQAINEVEVDRFLTKPIRPEELEKVVLSVVKKEEQAGTPQGPFADVLDPSKKK